MLSSVRGSYRLKSSLFSLFFAPMSALASVTTAETAEKLNLFLRAMEESPAVKIGAQDCVQLKEIASSLESGSSRFRSTAERFLRSSCDGEGSQLAHQEDQDRPASKLDDPVNVVWDGVALCQTANERILHCEHKAGGGRGLFVYAGQDSLENSPSLVCVHYEATYHSPFEREQEVSARCVVTEFDWRYESSRSDVVGIKNWLSADVMHSPIQIPAALKQQCSSVFPDALYCTPTLIVFPETDSTRVGICQLKTHDRLFGLGPILRVGSWNSRWDCESKSLVIPNPDERLSVEERQCVPDHLGRQQKPYCRLPYLPVARRPLRTYLEVK